METNSKNNFAIQLSNIGVCYRLYGKKVSTLKEAAVDSAHGFVTNFLKSKKDPPYRQHWAIRNVNLEIPKGVSVGFVGPNGSGKSTTLKVIAGVIFPTEGTLTVRGRISALIELGAGFDSELTGRENIYFGAAVSGLSRREIDRRMDSIIDFSELGEFIDVPVKNYSSGMYARLGFSLATDVDPDVLIIDEILSVGDQSFKEKCMLRMNEFKKQNKTIILVSHEPDKVQVLCDEAYHFETGKIVGKERLCEKENSFSSQVF